MVKLTLQWEGPPDHHEGHPAKLHHMCNSVEGVRKAYPSGCKAGTRQGLKKGSKRASPHRLY